MHELDQSLKSFTSVDDKSSVDPKYQVIKSVSIHTGRSFSAVAPGGLFLTFYLHRLMK